MATSFVRADVWALPADDPIVTGYADAVAAMQAKPAQDPTSWAFQSAIHGTHVSAPLPTWNQCRHQSWFFVSWHRMYLYYFERIVRAQVIANGGPRTWALPYWDYDGGGTKNTLPIAFRNPRRADGSANPLYVADRVPGLNAGAGLPSSITSPAFALGRPSFTGTSEFGGGVTSPLAQFWGRTGRLEQTPHNDVHSTIGGLMGDPATAALDPIFWLHHANIDRLWWEWQKHHKDPVDAAWTQQAFGFFDANGAAVSRTDAKVLRTLRQLHYTYDSSRLRIPWPPVRTARMTANWPPPWPPRRAAPDAGLPTAEPVRTLVGASEDPVRLVGDSVRVPVRIDERTTAALRPPPRVGRHEHRAFLDVEDIDAERNPGTVYGVYVNLPDTPTAADLAAHHVGNISLFGVERARNPRGDEHAHALHVSMEITDQLDRLAADGSWQDGSRIDTTFRPITLEPPADDDTVVAPAAHPDLPVTIGRVSVHFT